jgi:hypothetical protein
VLLYGLLYCCSENIWIGEVDPPHFIVVQLCWSESLQLAISFALIFSLARATDRGLRISNTPASDKLWKSSREESGAAHTESG